MSRLRTMLAALAALPLLSAPLAAQSIKVQVGTATQTSVAPNGTIDIPVTVDLTNVSTQNLASISVKVTWNPALLTLQNTVNGTFGSVTANTNNSATGEVVLSTFAATGTRTTFTLATLTFKAVGAAGSTATITPSVTAIGNESGQSLASITTTTPLALCIGTSGTYGDVNGDGAVNILDAQQVARSSVGLSVLDSVKVRTLGDVNSDNAVNILDAQLIARYSAGLSTTGARVGTALPGCTGGGGTTTTGILTGRVIDAVTGAGIAGATVRILNGATVVATLTTGADGSYTSAAIATGTYSVEASRTGYITATLYGAEVLNNQTVTLETIPLVPNSTNPGSISGTVRNARNNAIIAGATVELRSGLNVSTGTVIATTYTDANGQYQFTGRSAGTYSVVVHANGFTDGIRTGIVVGNSNTSGQDVVLSPLGATDEVRIVLTWGSSPYDLDSHLTGPSPSGRFHVYYSIRGALDSSPYAALDVDDQVSYGPETITITQLSSGTYRYSVHDYSNRGQSSSTALATSGAVVEVYRGSSRIARYSVPNAGGTLWTVFELSGSTLTPVNTMSYESSPGAVPNTVPGAEGEPVAGSDASVIRAQPPKR